jgi:ferric-dicitrate binding protein FerR (iron transport regulator)
VPSYQQTDPSHYVWERLSPAQQRAALTMLQQAQRQTERRRARLRRVALRVLLVLAAVTVTVLLLRPFRMLP